MGAAALDSSGEDSTLLSRSYQTETNSAQLGISIQDWSTLQLHITAKLLYLLLACSGWMPLLCAAWKNHARHAEFTNIC